MAARPVPSVAAAGLARLRLPLGAAVLALAFPLLFLHVRFQPELTVGRASVDLSDLAVLAVGLAALAAARREGLGPLRAGLPVWIAGGAFLALLFCSTLWGHAAERATHVVTAGKFAWYAVLALAVPLLVRRRSDLRVVLAGLVAWTAVTALVAVVQFFGVDIAAAWPAGRRQPSLIGEHDFATLCGASIGVAAVALAFGGLDRRERRVAWVAGVSGTIGLVLSGASTAGLGTLGAIAVVGLIARAHARLTRRGLAGLAALALALVLGLGVMRGSDLDHFVRFLGIQPKTRADTTNIQTYSQRLMLAYIGLRIWEDHPVLGVGYQGSEDAQGFMPYVPDARRAFPSLPAIAFPTPQNRLGVQMSYVQALADVGAVGLLLLLAVYAAGFTLAGRAALRPRAAPEGALAAAWLLVVAGTLLALGLVAGIPTDALWWLALGLAAACAAGRFDAERA